MQKITPMLWFDNQADEAAKFYTSVFSGAPGGTSSKLGTMTHYGDAVSKAAGRPAGSVMTASFELDGQEFVALNGGPAFKFTEAVSFVVTCETQEEVDYFWNKLSEGGQESACGWLKDKFGLSWQVTPTMLINAMTGPDHERSQRVMQAMLSMKKIIIADLEKAAGG